MANAHVKRWIEAWNKHDLQTVLSMYSEEIEFSSPKIKAVFPERTTSKIKNKKDLEAYWSKALKNILNSISYLKNLNSITMSVLSNIMPFWMAGQELRLLRNLKCKMDLSSNQVFSMVQKSKAIDLVIV